MQKPLLTVLIDYFFKESEIMATIQEVLTDVADLQTAITATDTKLDEVLAFIQSLQAAQPVTQAQLDELAALVAAAKVGAQAVLAEADAIDGQP